MRRLVNVLSVLVSVSSCAGEEADTTDDSGSDTGGAEWPPAVCDLGESPFLDAECLTALRLGCNEHAADGACSGAEPADFAGYRIRCAWVDVVTFTDATSCSIASTVGRCEAYIDQECPASCSAITSELEIIDLCGGPLGPWSAVGSDDDSVGLCAPNTQPPAPALCDCAPATCDPV